jgi:hypothetical protein
MQQLGALSSIVKIKVVKLQQHFLEKVLISTNFQALLW